MSNTAPRSHNAAALLAAVLASLVLHGSMLAGFDHVRIDASQMQAKATPVITLPTVEIVHARS